MADPTVTEEVLNAVSIPVMAKARIGHIKFNQSSNIYSYCSSQNVKLNSKVFARKVVKWWVVQI